MFEKEFQPILDGFKDILKRHAYNWDINQLHAYFPLDQRWSQADVTQLWETFLRHKGHRGAIDLYVHIPFCRARCSYCPFQSWIRQSSRQVETYLDYLKEEMRHCEALFDGVSFQRLLVGGGTPNILSDTQLQGLMEAILSRFDFIKGAVRTFECNPDLASDRQLRLLKNHGINKINFGVQTFNAKALRSNLRQYQTTPKVEKAIRLAKKAGFRNISIDLIVGLAGDTPAQFARSFEMAAKLKPANIIVHGLKPVRDDYLPSLLKMTGKKYFMHHYPQLARKALRAMSAIAQRHGYSGGAETMDPGRWQWGFVHEDYRDCVQVDRVYTGEFTGCSSILGLGVNARSHISRRAEYRRVKQPGAFKADAPVFEGRLLSPCEEMLKFILNHLDRNSGISRKAFRQLFGKDVAYHFPHAMTALRCLGKIRRANADRIDFIFRKPEDKYLTSLFFFREAQML